MTTQKPDILALLYEGVREYNAQAAPDKRLQGSAQQVLLGDGSPLDSLGLVHLLIGIEQRIADAFGVAITLADDKALSQAKSPFRTLDTLADYIHSLLLEEHAGKSR